MTIDEQLCALCKEHDLASISICMMSGHGRIWPQVSVQWEDETKSHGRGIATSEHGTPIADGIKQALERMHAERFKVQAIELVAVA